MGKGRDISIDIAFFNLAKLINCQTGFNFIGLSPNRFSYRAVLTRV